jgi:hypothetical protein
MNNENNILFSPSNVGFDIVQCDPIEPRYLYARITIEGQPLLDQVRSFEKGILKGTVDEKIAGSYWWLGAKALIRYLESLRSKEGQRISLLGCSCGDEDCWPLECTFCRQDDFIIWKDFLQPYRRNWDYSGFGPFAFQKQQFFSELDMLRARWYFAWKQNKRG